MSKLAHKLQVWHVAAFLGLAVVGFCLIFIKTHVRPEPVFVFPHDTTISASGSAATASETSDADGVDTVFAVVGRTYRLASVDGVLTPEDSHYQLSFDESLMSGSICNSFSGPYVVRRGKIFASLAATKMYCPDDRGAIEAVLFDGFNQGAVITVRSDGLDLLAGGIIYRYEVDLR
jgi:heat shock protein HslJ